MVFRVVPPLTVLALACVAGVSRADDPERQAGEAWLFAAGGGVGLLIGEPQRSLFGPALSGSMAGYRSLGPRFLVGMGLRGAMFFDRQGSDATRADPGTGGLGALSIIGRLRPFADAAASSRALGFWVEGAAGGGVTGKLFRPTLEAGLGYGLSLAPVVLAPTVRYVHVIQPGHGQDGSDAHLALVGIELMLGDRRLAPASPPGRPAPPPAPPAPPRDSDGDGIPDADDRCPSAPEDKDGFEDQDGCPDPDNDKDGIPDGADKCPNEAEVVNGIDDLDGCPDQGIIQLVDDRVVLAERLLFPTDRARVSPEGRRALEAVVTLWKQHPEWERMEVEGHADVRGQAAYNMWLSEERAGRVRTVLISLGLPAEKVTAKGFGNTRPRAEGRSDEALQQNRRVELVVIRKRPATEPAGQGAPRP
jgi:outer membrane protein OmpA-like peptidoglycan-associated protein